MSEIKQKYKDQISGLILTGADGRALDIISPLMNKNGENSFLVGNLDTQERYKVTVKIEEF